MTPRAAEWADPVWHLYVIRAENRDEIQDALAAEEIASGMHYPLPLHLQPALARLGHTAGDFPATEEWGGRCSRCRTFPELEAAEVERIAAVVTAVGATPA